MVLSRCTTSGSSAGGQLAIGVAVLDEVNDPSDDTSISPIPAGIILYCPVLNAGPDGYQPIYRRITDNYKPFSPIHNLEGKKLPPQIILIGDFDHVIPVPQAKKYQEICTSQNAPCEVEVFPGAKHGAFYGDKFRELSTPKAKAFLEKHNRLPQL